MACANCWARVAVACITTLVTGAVSGPMAKRLGITLRVPKARYNGKASQGRSRIAITQAIAAEG